VHRAHRHAQIVPGPERPGPESVEARPAQRPVFRLRQSPQDPDEDAVLYRHRLLPVGQAPGAGAVPGAVIRLRSASPDPDGSATADRWHRSAEIPPVQAFSRGIEDGLPV